MQGHPSADLSRNFLKDVGQSTNLRFQNQFCKIDEFEKGLQGHFDALYIFLQFNYAFNIYIVCSVAWRPLV